MSIFSDFLYDAWSYRFSLSDLLMPLFTYRFSPLPVVATYLIFDSTALIRKFTKTAYVPMYFMFFPTGHSDRLYAQYFGEDDFFGGKKRLTKSKKLLVAKKIRRIAVFSMLAATVLAPYLCGFIAALYLQPSQFSEFLVFLLVVKGLLIVSALRMLRRESMVVWDNRTFAKVLAMYGLYLVLVFYGLTESYEWTVANIHNYTPLQLLSGFFRYLYVKLIVEIIFVSLATWAITDRFLASPEQ
jgi:hypothetical protein